MIRERLARKEIYAGQDSCNITVIECATFVGAPVGFDNLARERSHLPALVGEHSGTVRSQLDYSDGEVSSLHADGITHLAN